ncbi:MAG: PaaI family thioesterase [Deltaproteobacteria bacterium]|nr:PaaI family thioesterase [Deltaproteobacteria bacterium]
MKHGAFQDHYSDETSYCYGCGRFNEHGLRIKSYWDEEGVRTVCRFRPSRVYTALPGYVYGGLIASLIDCHGTGSAAAFAHHASGLELGSDPSLRFVTASLHVDFLAPTPIECELVLLGFLDEIKGRRVVVRVELRAKGELCAKGRVVAVRPRRLPINNGKSPDR